MKKNKYVQSDEHLQLCMLNKVKMDVIFFGEVDHVGVIKRFDEKIIAFHDCYYPRENVTLKICSK